MNMVGINKKLDYFMTIASEFAFYIPHLLTNADKKKMAEVLAVEYKAGFLDGYRTCKTNKKALTETEKKILAVIEAQMDLLFYKNKKYGDSALNPLNVFSNKNSSSSIEIRLDDKFSRILNASNLAPTEKELFVFLFKRVFLNGTVRKNDLSDLNNYLILLQASLNYYNLDEFKD